MARRNANAWEADLLGIVIMAVLIAVVVVGTLLYLTVTELWRIYRDRATGETGTGRFLWGALAGLLGVLFLAGLLSVTTHNGSVGLAVAALSFFLYVLAIEYIDYLARRKEVPVHIPAALSLSDVASWRPASDTTVQRMNNRSNAA
jgi:predicted lysophospholipase L1 biosynthesis ABC-type transport system permease subunit